MIVKVKAFVGCVFLAISSIVSQAQAPPVSAQSSSPAGKEVEEDGCLGRKTGRLELTNSSNWVVYYLTGQTAGLEDHIGDEVKVHGIETSPEKPSAPSTPWERVAPTLQVSSVEILMRKNPAGVPPILGKLDTWVSYDNPQYGVRLRYPATFTPGRRDYPSRQTNFAGEAASVDNPIVNVGIPGDTYPESNFVDGTFTVIVNPKIGSEGTCKQFRTFWPEHTGQTIVNGITYSRTLDTFPAMGTDYSGYDLHTFQNGLCYEFSFDFAETNGGAMDIPCSIQWVSDDNEFELMQAVLSQVSFSKPKLNREAGEVPSQTLVPSVISFEHGPIPAMPTTIRSIPMGINVSWKTTNADYVQIRYPCMESVLASTVQSSGYGLGQCGESTDTNLPANGSMGLMVDNFTPNPVDLVFTLEPFRDGLGYPKEEKTISIPVSPRPPVQESQQPFKPATPQPQERTFTGCLKAVAGTNAYWLLPAGVIWQLTVKSDTVDLSPYANHTVKVTAVRKDMQPYWIATSVTTLSDSCPPEQ